MDATEAMHVFLHEPENPERLSCLRRALAARGEALPTSLAWLLDWAIMAEDPTAVALILRAGADPDGDPGELDPPLTSALQRREGWREMVRLLVAAGADLERRGLIGTTLHAAVQTGEVDRVRLILDLGGAIDAPAEDDDTPLHKTAYWNLPEICRLLLDRGANPLLRESAFDRTPADILRSHPEGRAAELLAMLEVAEADWRASGRGGGGERAGDE